MAEPIPTTISVTPWRLPFLQQSRKQRFSSWIGFAPYCLWVFFHLLVCLCPGKFIEYLSLKVPVIFKPYFLWHMGQTVPLIAHMWRADWPMAKIYNVVINVYDMQNEFGKVLEIFSEQVNLMVNEFDRTNLTEQIWQNKFDRTNFLRTSQSDGQWISQNKSIWWSMNLVRC